MIIGLHVLDFFLGIGQNAVFNFVIDIKDIFFEHRGEFNKGLSFFNFLF